MPWPLGGAVLSKEGDPVQRTVIVGYARTPFGRFLGGLKDVPAVELGGHAIREAQRRAGLDPTQVD